MGYQKMNRDGVIQLYRDLLWLRGRASCGSVAKELAERGVVTHTGNPPTRQAIHWHMKRGPEEYILGEPLDAGDYAPSSGGVKINEALMLLDVTNVYNRGHDPHYYPLEYIDTYLEQEGFTERWPEVFESDSE